MTHQRTKDRRRGGPRSARGCAVLALAGLLALVLPAPAATAATPGATAAAPTVAHGAVLRAVVDAGGVQQFVRCTGPVREGRPTVVIISGLGVGTESFRPVVRDLATTERVCRYDRPGLGRSPARPVPTVVNAGRHAAELAALLDAIEVTGPLVLVAHSYGGMVARAFAVKYPDRVAGLVLVDSVYPTQWYGGSSRFWPEANTSINMRRSQRVVGAGPALGREPLVVLTAGRGSSRGWLAQQAAMIHLADRAQHLLVTRSSHTIQIQDPAAVALAARIAVRGVVHERPVRRCARLGAAWAAVGARCL